MPLGRCVNIDVDPSRAELREVSGSESETTIPKPGKTTQAKRGREDRQRVVNAEKAQRRTQRREEKKERSSRSEDQALALTLAGSQAEASLHKA